jgi:selenocysteine lyase/cysteine desulfurase
MSGKFLLLLLGLLLIQEQTLGLEEKNESVISPPSFGHEMLHKEFLLNYTNFNHGSFGACPKQVLDFQTSLRLQQEQQPDPWMRFRYKQLINETRKEIARYVHAEDGMGETLVLVESASTAVNSIMRSMAWQPGDVIMYFSVAYAMVENTALWLQQEEGIEIVQVPIHFPIKEEEASRAFTGPLQQALQTLKDESKIGKLRLVVLDHIASAPAVKEPISELARLIKSFQENCLVLVDGAHSTGQVRALALSDMGPIDAYVSNGHKWFFAPKGSAFLWVNNALVTREFPEPTVISSANSLGTPFSERYAYVSPRDYTAMIAMSKALEFRQYVGGDEAIYTHNRNLALAAKHYRMDIWNVGAMAPDSLEEFMINIMLPISDVSVANELMYHSLRKHNMYIRVLYDKESGIVYTRLSSQIYL